MAAQTGSNNVAEQGLAREFDMLAARAGLVIPADRRADLLVAFGDLRAEIARLHGTLPATLEPAAIYRPDMAEAQR